MRRAHALAVCSLRNSAWHHMRNIALIDRCFDRTVKGWEQERQNIREREMKQTSPQKPSCMEGLVRKTYKTYMIALAGSIWNELLLLNAKRKVGKTREKKPDGGEFVTTSGSTWATSVAETMSQRWLGTGCLCGGQRSDEGQKGQKKR